MVKMNFYSYPMDLYQLILGVFFFFFGLILMLIQIREEVYFGKNKVNAGDIRLSYAAISAILAGLYFVFTSF